MFYKHSLLRLEPSSPRSILLARLRWWHTHLVCHHHLVICQASHSHYERLSISSTLYQQTTFLIFAHVITVVIIIPENRMPTNSAKQRQTVPATKTLPSYITAYLREQYSWVWRVSIQPKLGLSWPLRSDNLYLYFNSIAHNCKPHSPL